ncbi:Putative autophagy protein ATG17 [Septoria linicola]|uniref:Autophagy-related protein 11 n=1 Tax=Septoria linicola TaxID=215465 RepID=A0A9Q9B155_9PEZI|nr:putative autophagy protein ATG17 [Septoria linicola]USW55386.1 Putative autophagy protein ATG17 [Septoria linicola]
MSISVFIGHTGQCLRLDPSVISTLEAVRSWIASQADIQTRSQILLTAQGKQVRTQTLLTETELYVFDSSWLNGKKATSPSRDSTESLGGDDFNPGPAPDTIASTSDLASWQNLFKGRRSWAAGLLKGCETTAKQAERLRERKAVIERSLGVAVASLQQHIKSAEKQYGGVETWAAEQLQEQQAHADNWEHNLESLRRIPARPEFTRFVQPMVPVTGSRRNSQQYIATLQGYVDIVTVKQAATAARASMSALSNKLDNIRAELDSATNSSNELLNAVDQINDHSLLDDSTSDPAQLLEEIDMVVKKMASDLEHVQSQPKTPQACAQASKMALLHTRNYLPNLNDYCVEMNELVQKSRRERDSAADTALEHMRTLSAIESQLAKLYQDIKEVDMPEDQQQPFVTLSTVSRLPSVYGHLLVESVRRREWVAKMKRDSATLQEEVALYQEEEEKRRRKWMRNVDDLVSADALQTRVLGIELNLQNEGGSWPMVTREELADYLNTLLETFGQGPVTDEIDQAIKDLDKLTRKQIKHAKAFKNGSMHEAAFGDTSLFLRGDDSNKTLQSANARLEEEVKAQKSRVRKLEDLLHRSTQLSSKASTGDIFTPTSDGALSHRVSTPTIPVGTPQPFDDFSRNNSLSKRRPSFAQGQGQEEKRLAKRVVDLEAELQAHKDEVATRKNSDAEVQKQVEEAMTTKKDLMANMDAQQREFAVERRNLERELAEAKEKIEEAENEVERLIGSRDGIDEEISRLKEDAAGHAARAATEHDARSTLERRYDQAESARKQVEEDLWRLQEQQELKRETDAEHLQLLTTAHAHLLADSEAPTGFQALATALEDLARKSAAHAKDLEEAIAFARSENKSLWVSNERQKSELTAAAQQQADTEEELRLARDKLSAEEAKAQSLEQQLSEEQEQLQSLRNKFAEGETGSEVLRQRVTEEEERVAKLRTELAEAKSLNNSLDVEILRMQKKQKAYHAGAEATSERLQKRAERAKEVSQKLYSQNLRLVRLLERLGLVVTHEGDRMAVERASKMAASTTMMDPSMYMSRQASLTSPPPTRKSSTADDEPANDLKMLHWADAQHLEEENAQYEAFINNLSRFDLDVFADAVTKRVKDFEYTAKKYSKEAKESTKRADAYKERALKLRGEAHAKIAVRDFKEGDLALFLPTRGGQVKGAWAAFNIGCPHYFLAEREGMRLGSRDFIVARIQKVEQKIVDLSGQRAAAQIAADGHGTGQASDAGSSMQVEDENPFDLSDGLTWWMVHATEERGAGAAPTTPGLGKSTVSTANVDAKGSIRIKRSSKGDDASKHLNKSLDSRRSSSTSKKNFPATSNAATGSASATPHAETPRQRSESQASSLNNPMLPTSQPPRPPPAAAGSGLGITNDPQPHEQIRKLSVAAAAETSRPTSSGSSPATVGQRRPSASPSKTRQRSQSPSKSVRSLQRHLETPTKASSAKKNGWESLWSAEFSVESPSKEKKKMDWH